MSAFSPIALHVLRERLNGKPFAVEADEWDRLSALLLQAAESSPADGASVDRKIAARDLHYTLIEQYGLKDDPVSNHTIRQGLERLAGITPEPDGQAAEEKAFAWGWRLCANWAKRDDLVADIGSPAYLADMRSALTKRTSLP